MGCGGYPPFRPNPLAPFPRREGGKFWQVIGGEVNPATSGTQNAGKPSANEGGKTLGVQGGEAPMAGGVGGGPPQNLKRGQAAHISNPATGGAQNTGEPSANGGGQTGVEGATPPPRGFGGCAPRIKEGANCPH